MDAENPRPEPVSEIGANQPPPFDNVNLFSSDTALREALRRESGGAHEPQVEAFGARIGSSEVWALASDANRHPPELRAFDRYGERIDEVAFHPAYHALMRIGLEAGTSSGAWRGIAAGHVLHAALEFLLAEVEQSVCCPITMTYAAPAALKHAPEIAARWLPRILATRYDPTSQPASAKLGVTIGMAMTERQGGSDVRTNTTYAERLDDGNYVLTGQKWFCSAPMSDAFLTLAQAPGGLTCFLTPRWRPDGKRNAIHLMRLKDKLGDRANASAEIAYARAHALRIGEEGRGIPTILEMVHHTRLDCAIAPAAYMRTALAQALWHAEHRRTFGKALIDHALMRRLLADLALESEAATALAFRLARSFDEAPESEQAALFSRLATPVAKYWLNKRVVPHVAECVECHGGAGYIEEWPMARLYRQAPLNGIWEGSGNIICLDVLRVLSRTPLAKDALVSEIEQVTGANPDLDRAIANTKTNLARAEIPEPEARLVTESLALVLQAALLVQHAPPFVADAFCGTRLSGNATWTFGSAPIAADTDSILARAKPQL